MTRRTWFGNSWTNGWQSFVSSSSMGTSCVQNLFISRCNSGHKSVFSLEAQVDRTHHKQHNNSTPESSMCSNWQWNPWLQTPLDRNTLQEMYLGEVPIYTIMLMGRWSSDAFVRYICKQVEQFLCDILKRMLNFCSFHHIPDIRLRRILVVNPPNTIHHMRVSSNDPRQRNHHDNAKKQKNIGHDKSCRVQLPAFSHYQKRWRKHLFIAYGIRGRGELNKNSNSKPNPHLVHLIVQWRGVWLQRGTLLCGRQPRSKRAERKILQEQEWNLEPHSTFILIPKAVIKLGSN